LNLNNNINCRLPNTFSSRQPKALTDIANEARNLILNQHKKGYEVVMTLKNHFFFSVFFVSFVVPIFLRDYYINRARMITKNKIKLISSLNQKKFRDDNGLFVAEGTKLITDMTATYKIRWLFATSEWAENYPTINGLTPEIVDQDELKKISNMKTPQGVLAVFEKPVFTWGNNDLRNSLTLALDDVQDPGNLGTIIRIADWFGIRHIFCSEYTADAFGPKTVQATMGALSRVQVHYVNMVGFLTEAARLVPVYGTFMDGQNVYNEKLTREGVVVMGNEGNGISPDVEKLVTSRLLIPNFPAGEPTSESLNVGVATALVCAEFRRRMVGA